MTRGAPVATGRGPVGGPARADDTHLVRALLVAIGVLLLLRVPAAGPPGLWIDEAFSIHHARAPLVHLWTEGWRLESSPPLYYTTLWAWVRLVGDSEAGARLLSVLLMAVAAAFLFRAGRALAGRTAGALAAAVVLLPALAFEYSLEIRPYALQMVFIAGTVSALAHALVAHRDGHLDRPAAVVRSVLPVVLAATATFYTHTTSFAFLLGLAAATAFHGWRTRAARGYWTTWALAGVALAVLCAPQLRMALGVLDSNRYGLAWIPSSFDLRYVSMVARHLVLGQIYWHMAITIGLAALVYAGFAAAAWRMRARPEVLAIGVVLPLVGVTAIWVAGLSQPILMIRTVLWAWAPLAVLVGCAAATLDPRGRAARLLVPAAVLLSVSTTIGYLLDRPNQRPWAAAIAALESRLEPGDGVLMLDSEVGCLLARYAGPTLAAAPRARLHLGRFGDFRLGQRLSLGCNDLPVVGGGAVGRLQGGADWVLTGDERQRSDLARLLEREGDRLRVTDQVIAGRRPMATRVVDVTAVGRLGGSRRP